MMDISKDGLKIPVDDYPMLDNFDVIVCGAGPAGVGAAISAAREKSRTLLLEQSYSIGGMAAGSGVSKWCDTPGGSVFDELERRMDVLGKARRAYDPERHTNRMGRVVLHGETLKAVALKMIKDSGAEVLLGVTAVDALLVEGQIKGVIAATKAGLCLIGSKVIIDCTADANIAAAAGADWLKGDPEDGRLMHVNFRFIIGGADYDKYEREKLPEAKLVNLIKKAHGEGELRPPRGVFRPGAELFPYCPEENLLLLNDWEIEKVDCSDPFAVSDILIEGQLAALQVIEFARKYLPGYGVCFIERFWEKLGTRESRRVKGLYTLTGEDVVSGRKFRDGIARAAFFIDFHDSPPGRTIPYDIEYKSRNSPPEGDYYEIPYRCLLTEKISNLIIAGRCVSADRRALASLRVMPTCMYIGEAAGVAAATAVKEDIFPGAVDPAKIREKMGF